MKKTEIDGGVSAAWNLESLMDVLAAAVATKLEPHMAATVPIHPRLLSVRQASKYLGCSEPSIYHQIKDGKLVVVRRDRRVFLDVKDLDRMIEECKQRIA
jgi:excisionase family DNA binding protein